MMINQADPPSSPLAEQPARLVVLLRPLEPAEGLEPVYRIDRFPATIGRHELNSIEIANEAISRYHARLERVGSQFRLLDLRSSNGTWLNDRRIQVAMIDDSDIVSFGSVKFIVAFETSDGLPISGGSPGGVERDGTSEIHLIQQADHAETIHSQPADQRPRLLELEEALPDEPALAESRRRLIGLSRLQGILHAAAGDEARMMKAVLELLFDVLPVSRGAILTRDILDAQLFRPVAVRSRARGGGDSRIGISRGVLQRCLREKVALLTRDAGGDLHLRPDAEVPSPLRSVICAPLISGAHVLGFCHLETLQPERAFTNDDLTYLVGICGQTSVHLHNLRMTREKIQSERMAAIGQTITGMAHNIKNILLLSQGGIEMMEKSINRRNYETLEETWGLVRRGLDRINSLVQDMLEYSRPRHVEREQMNVNNLLAELALTFADELRRRGVHIELDPDPEVPELPLDRRGLEKALVNLIVNAIEAAESQDGWIALSTRMLEDGNLVIHVRDGGPGIPRELLSRVFIPFFTTKGSKGSGLGLPITRKIIEDMGGRIEVHSEEGRETCFTITLNVGPDVARLGSSTAGQLDEEQP